MQKSVRRALRRLGEWLAALKARLYKFISHAHETHKPYKIFMITLITLNFAAVVIGTFDVPDWSHTVLAALEAISISVFAIEYLIRIWVADMTYPECSPFRARLKFIASFMGIVDFLAICPFFLPHILKADLRMLHMLRLSRTITLIKLGRFRFYDTVKVVVKKKWSVILAAWFADFIFISVLTMIIYSVENAVQPDVFKNAFDSLRWTFSTLTAIGYNGAYPITALGTLLSSVIVLLGIGVIAIPAVIISHGVSEELKKKNQVCPHCGEFLYKATIADNDKHLEDGFDLPIYRTSRYYHKAKHSPHPKP